MEVLGSDAELGDLRDFLANIVSYVLENDVEIQDGVTIGFSADDKHTITRSPGVALPEDQMTLKLSYVPSERNPEDKDEDYALPMDDGTYHLRNLWLKKLPVDEINAYNHMSIYLRWCMENDLMEEKFLEEYGAVV
jgi:hypothetical protein